MTSRAVAGVSATRFAATRFSISWGDAALALVMVALAGAVTPAAWRSVESAAESAIESTVESAVERDGRRDAASRIAPADALLVVSASPSPERPVAAPPEATAEAARTRLLEQLKRRTLFGEALPPPASQAEALAPPQPLTPPAPPAPAFPEPPELTLRGVVDTAAGPLALAVAPSGRRLRLRVGDPVPPRQDQADASGAGLHALGWRVIEIRGRALVLAAGAARRVHRLVAAPPTIAPTIAPTATGQGAAAPAPSPPALAQRRRPPSVLRAQSPSPPQTPSRTRR